MKSSTPPIPIHIKNILSPISLARFHPTIPFEHPTTMKSFARSDVSALLSWVEEFEIEVVGGERFGEGGGLR